MSGRDTRTLRNWVWLVIAVLLLLLLAGVIRTWFHQHEHLQQTGRSEQARSG